MGILNPEALSSSKTRSTIDKIVNPDSDALSRVQALAKGGNSAASDYLSWYGARTSTSDITSDSTSASDAEKSIRSDIDTLSDRAGLSGDVDDYLDDLRDLQDAQEREIERQRKLLEARRAREVAGINEGFGVLKTETEGAQKKETGFTSMQLARAGGYLGQTASHQGVMQNLAIAQRNEMVAMEAQKNEAVRAANNAYEDRDFELAQELLQSARDLEQEIYNRRTDFFNQQLDLSAEYRARASENRESVQFTRDAANERIDRLIDAGATPDSNDIREIAMDIDMSPDEVKQIFDAAKEARDLDMKDQKTDRELAILNTLRGIPRDQTVTIDGKTYRGMAELSSSGTSYTERKDAAKETARAELMDDIRGGINPETGVEIAPITLDEALKSYPDLDTKEITEIFEALKEYEDDAEVKAKLDSGEWAVATTFSDSGTLQETYIYDKTKYKAALDQWVKDSEGGLFDIGAQGHDVEVSFDGKIYEGTGIKIDDVWYPPVRKSQYRVNRDI